jgi:uncharacterized membrane protein YedE/YeeE
MEKQRITDVEFDPQRATVGVSSSASLNSLKYVLAGLYFGIVLVQAQVVSWFRIQEMFRFQSFHMYGVIGSAVVTAALSFWIIRKFRVRSVEKETISITPKKFHKGLIIGGLMFGIGWALTGACPGPIFAQIGMGFSSAWIVLISALASTYFYGRFRNRAAALKF